MNIVPTDVSYTSLILRQNLRLLNYSYPFLNIQTIGNSVMGNNLYVVKLGNGPNKVFYSGSIHANEWITSVVLMKFIEEYCQNYTSNGSLYNVSIKKLFDNSSIYIMPMVNPDGVDLVTGRIFQNSNYYRQAKKIDSKFPNIPFPAGWKANIRGVDLKNFQPFCKVLHFLIYTALLVFPFSFIISSILINSSKFSVIEFNFEKLKYI